MDLGLKNRVAFVAGASSGLGRAVAKELVAEGARVAICSRSKDRIEAAATSLDPTRSGRVLPVVCDVTRESEIARAIAETTDRFGGLNILVANAGGPPAGTLDDFDAAAWEAALQLNLMSTINLCRTSVPALRTGAKAGLGRIIMITSISAKQPIPTLYLSNVARAGVQGFAKSLAAELGPEGITVNTVLPGYTRTDRLSHLSEALRDRTGNSVEAIEAGWAADSALKRIGTEAEFAASVAFLASSRASYITGVALSVDGGATKGLL